MTSIRRCALLALALAASVPAAAQNVLFNSNHPGERCFDTLYTANSLSVPATVYFEQNQIAGPPSAGVTDVTFAAQGTNTSNTNYTVGTTTPANHAPYKILSQSLAGYGANNPNAVGTNVIEPDVYDTLVASNLLYNVASLQYPALPAQWTMPGAALIGTGQCTAGSSQSGPGVTWCAGTIISSKYGCDVTSPSGSTATISGVLAALEYNHGSWNPFDVEAVARQTAANFASGYNASNYGYGEISYDAANAYSGTIWLQPPDIAVKQRGQSYALLTIMPFKQTRYDHVEIYAVTAAYSWPLTSATAPHNPEYTLADLVAGGASLICSTATVASTPCGVNTPSKSQVFVYSPPVAGTYTLVAVTADASGNYSRVEPFMPLQITISGSQACY